MFDHLFCTCTIFIFKVEINSLTLIPLFRPESIHSVSASWVDCGWVFPDKLCVSLFCHSQLVKWLVGHSETFTSAVGLPWGDLLKLLWIRYIYFCCATCRILWLQVTEEHRDLRPAQQRVAEGKDLPHVAETGWKINLPGSCSCFHRSSSLIITSLSNETLMCKAICL